MAIQRRWFQFRLWTILAIVAALGVAFAMIRERRGELAWCGAIPFAAGLALGEFMPKRDRFNPSAILFAPFIAPIVVWVCASVASMVEVVANPNPYITTPVVFQVLLAPLGAIILLPGVFIFGAIPAIAGSTLSHVLKRRDM